MNKINENINFTISSSKLNANIKPLHLVEQNKDSNISNLPDYLIVSQIFPYLTTKELFLSVRGLSSYFHDIIKSAWSGSIKDEMCSQLKNLSAVYEKNALTKTYEFKLEYLINYRTIISMYTIHSNILSVLCSIIDLINDNEIYNLVLIFMGVLNQEELISIITNNTKNIEERKLLLQEKLNTEEVINDYKNKIDNLLNVNPSSEQDEDNEMFINLQNEFIDLNNEYIEGLNENCRLLYNFLQGVIEYRILKKNVKSLKAQVESLFKKIQTETEQWPKRKKFFETSYKFLYLSSSSNRKTNFIKEKLEKLKLKTPLDEYKEEAYLKMLELKNDMEYKKNKILEIKKNINNQGETISTEKEMNEINKMFLGNLLERRILLSKKINVLEKFYNIYEQCLCYDELTYIKYFLLNKENDIKIFDENLFFVVLVVTYKAKGYDFNVLDVDKYYKIIVEKAQINQKIKEIEETKNFNNNKIIRKYNSTNETNYNNINSNNDINNNIIFKGGFNGFDKEVIENEKKKEILNLKREKLHLLLQKKKTEQILNVLKKYLSIKQKLIKNKKKYKLLLFILNKLNKNICDNDNDNFNYDNINEMLENINVNEGTDINLDDINDTENDDLKKFEQSDYLLKEIENKILNQINKCFNSNDNNIINNNYNNKEEDEKKN